MHSKYLILELKRKTVHLTSLLILIPLLFLSREHNIKLFAVFCLVAFFLHWYHDKKTMREKYLRKTFAGMPLTDKGEREDVVFRFYKEIRRKHEKEPALSTFYFAFSVFISLILFGVNPVIFGVLAVSIGDTFSAFVGKKFGKIKILYNKEKSLAGSAAFLVTTFIATAIFLYFYPQLVSIHILKAALLISLVGTFAETIPTINDNITVPMFVAAAVWLISLI